MKKSIFIAVLFATIICSAQSSTVKVVSTATSGNITLPNTQQDVIFLHDPGTLTLNLNITFPANPVDGQQVIIASASGITNLNLSAAIGSIASPLLGLNLGGNATWIFSSERNKWFRIR